MPSPKKSRVWALFCCVEVTKLWRFWWVAKKFLHGRRTDEPPVAPARYGTLPFHAGTVCNHFANLHGTIGANRRSAFRGPGRERGIACGCMLAFRRRLAAISVARRTRAAMSFRCPGEPVRAPRASGHSGWGMGVAPSPMQSIHGPARKRRGDDASVRRWRIAKPRSPSLDQMLLSNSRNCFLASSLAIP